MKLLILGGTIFLGRHIVEAALQRGHEVTLYHRGQHNPDLFAERVETVLGDRTTDDISALAGAGRRWDAVIDTCGYVPRVVRAAAESLINSVDHYTFISTISVYADLSMPGADEDVQLAAMPDPVVDPMSITEMTGETYGPLKALCEQAVMRAFPNRTLIVRPGIIVGPHDPSDRFTYWPWQIAYGDDPAGEILVPQPEDRALQFIDVRDLAEWTLRQVESAATGTYNVTGPTTPISMRALLEESARVAHRPLVPLWVPESFFAEHENDLWSAAPLCTPGDEARGIFSVDIRRALARGLTFRPLEATIRDTLHWATTRGPDYVWRAGLPLDRLRDLTAKWRHSLPE